MANGNDAYQLREPTTEYIDDFGVKNEHIGANNSYFWNVYPDISKR